MAVVTNSSGVSENEIVSRIVTGGISGITAPELRLGNSENFTGIAIVDPNTIGPVGPIPEISLEYSRQPSTTLDRLAAIEEKIEEKIERMATEAQKYQDCIRLIVSRIIREDIPNDMDIIEVGKRFNHYMDGRNIDDEMMEIAYQRALRELKDAGDKI
jgi:hypothetical protein